MKSEYTTYIKSPNSKGCLNKMLSATADY